jgi:hypothetical protein
MIILVADPALHFGFKRVLLLLTSSSRFHNCANPASRLRVLPPGSTESEAVTKPTESPIAIAPSAGLLTMLDIYCPEQERLRIEDSRRSGGIGNEPHWSSTSIEYVEFRGACGIHIGASLTTLKFSECLGYTREQNLVKSMGLQQPVPFDRLAWLIHERR